MRGDLRDEAAAARAVRRRRGGLPRGARCRRCRAASRSRCAPTRVERRRHAQRARGGAPGGRAPRGVRGLVVGLRRHARSCPRSRRCRRIRVSPYALQKHAGEVYCRLYHELYGLETVALRYFNVFGPRQDPEERVRRGDAALRRRACLRGEPRHDLRRRRADARLHLRCGRRARQPARRRCAERASGEVINVAGGRRISLNELLAAIRGDHAARRSRRVHGPARAGDVRDSLADLARARDLLGFEPAGRRCARGCGAPSRASRQSRASRRSRAMNVCVIGTGYVGLVTGACFAEFGMQVVCADKDARQDRGAREAARSRSTSPASRTIVARNLREGRLSFTTDTAEAVRASLVVFIAVGTPAARRRQHRPHAPSRPSRARSAASMDGYKVIVTKSTVPVGTSYAVQELDRARSWRAPDERSASASPRTPSSCARARRSGLHAPGPRRDRRRGRRGGRRSSRISTGRST